MVQYEFSNKIKGFILGILLVLLCITALTMYFRSSFRPPEVVDSEGYRSRDVIEKTPYDVDYSKYDSTHLITDLGAYGQTSMETSSTAAFPLSTTGIPPSHLPPAFSPSLTNPYSFIDNSYPLVINGSLDTITEGNVTVDSKGVECDKGLCPSYTNTIGWTCSKCDSSDDSKHVEGFTSRTYKDASSNYSASNIYPYRGIVPRGYYQVDASFIAQLPPGNRPNVLAIDISGTPHTPTLSETFGMGYVSAATLESKVFTITTPGFPVGPDSKIIFPLPPNLYYTIPRDLSAPWAHNKVQYLPYGKIANADAKGIPQPGFHDNPNLISPNGNFNYDMNYKDVNDNYDVVFHDTPNDIGEQNNLYDVCFNFITVQSKDGKTVLLPRSAVQGDVTYYQPGAYTFDAATYVPKYEDSVYLSRTSMLPTTAPYQSAFKQVGFCEADKASPIKLEENCNALNGDVCATSSCCVLLGGSKCVSGNEQGPALKQNYSDLFVRNRDYYIHMGKCYGNCP